jgi:hypothetical protein
MCRRTPDMDWPRTPVLSAWRLKPRQQEHQAHPGPGGVACGLESRRRATLCLSLQRIHSQRQHQVHGQLVEQCSGLFSALVDLRGCEQTAHFFDCQRRVFCVDHVMAVRTDGTQILVWIHGLPPPTSRQRIQVMHNDKTGARLPVGRLEIEAAGKARAPVACNAHSPSASATL